MPNVSFESDSKPLVIFFSEAFLLVASGYCVFSICASDDGLSISFHAVVIWNRGILWERIVRVVALSKECWGWDRTTRKLDDKLGLCQIVTLSQQRDNVAWKPRKTQRSFIEFSRRLDSESRPCDNAKIRHNSPTTRHENSIKLLWVCRVFTLRCHVVA